MNTLIIAESYFGSTLQITHATADALPNTQTQGSNEMPVTDRRRPQFPSSFE